MTYLKLLFILIFSISTTLIADKLLAEEIDEFNQLPPEVQMALELEKYKVRLKDIVSFEGIRDNILMGYGLVVGLSGSGDNLKNAIFTKKELENFLERLGVSSNGGNIKTKNVAAVTITATLPPFTRVGSKINVTLGTLGDAKSLMGGILLATPLLGADGEVYAVAQGNVIVGKINDEKQGKKLYTTGYVNSGAIIEKEINFALNSMTHLNIGLREPDITTAKNVEKVINNQIGRYAQAIDPATIKLKVPKKYRNNVLSLLGDIEQLKISVETPARIIIDTKTGMIVMNSNVKVDSVVIAKEDIVVNVGGKQENRLQVSMINKNINLKDLINGLNKLGTAPLELVEILENIKSLGALHAEIISR